MRLVWVFVFSVVALSFIASLYAYPQLPERVASHWNAAGEVDGYMPRGWGSFLMPLVLLGLAGLFAVIPVIDPLRENIEKFRVYYDGFIAVMMLFMFGVHVQGLLWNLGHKISPNAVMPVGVGLLLYYAGVLTENAKRNWFIGIRTPWTLSNDVVWEKTHRIGGRMFKACGLIALAGVFIQEHVVYLILVPVLATAAYTTVYSYLEYRKEVKE
jgi:uncharacterized membrane protein